jgi:hypothetical protein
VVVVDGVEAAQGRVEADVGFRELVAEKDATGGYPLHVT